MSPDDDAYRQIQKYRAREWVIGAILALSALGSSFLYVTLLRGSLGMVWIILLVALEWLIMGGIYFLLVSQMRKRRR